MPNILFAKKITSNPHKVSKHRIAYKLFVIIQQMCYSVSWDLQFGKLWNIIW